MSIIIIFACAAAVLEYGLLKHRQEPAITTSKPLLSAPSQETKEIDESPLCKARPDPMILAIAGDVSSEPGSSHHFTNASTTKKKSNKPSQHKQHGEPRAV